MAKRDTVLRPVHPNLGIAAAYRRRLQALIQEMAASFEHWIAAQYRKTPPRIAQDATPSAELRSELRRLGIQWQRRFDAMAPKLARWFAQAASQRSDAALRKILADGGIAVKWKMTPAQRDVLGATVEESISLIKSIPEQYHRQVEGLVMRSVQTGRDLQQLTKDLHKRYDITRKRAILIARDQNNKATASLTRARQLEVGIEQAVWLHSHGGKEPRPTHLRNSGKRYNVAEGWYDPDPRVRRRIFPGELINCRCVSKAVVKGFS